MRQPKLSVVVIGRNEADNLRRCFESIYRAIQVCPSVDIDSVIYVDSGSADASVMVAKCYADRVFVLDSEPTAAAGRKVGHLMANGDIILFLDGDMELDQDWLEPALRELAENPSLAGVCGQRDDCYVCKATNEVISVRKNVYGADKTRVAPHFGGAVMLRKYSLDLVGSYNPFLRSGEEPELYARLRARGFLVKEMPLPFIRHYTPVPTLRNKLKRLILGAPYFGVAMGNAVAGRFAVSFIELHLPTFATWFADILTTILYIVLQRPLGIWVALAIQAVLTTWMIVIQDTNQLLTARVRLLALPWGIAIWMRTKMWCSSREDVLFHEV